MKQTNKGAQPEVAGHPPAESVEKRPPAKGNPCQLPVPGIQGLEPTSSRLIRIREAARRDTNLRFTSLLHHVSVGMLHRAFHDLNKGAAAGVDKVTWHEYNVGLNNRLEDLHDRVQSGRYRAKPSKRRWIPKSDGRQRPLGVAALEDKIVQQAFVLVLQEIYELDFLGFSYGFRPGRSQHNALDALYVAITEHKVNWIIDADIRGFFDSISHEWLLKFVGHRIGDKRVLRLIRKFLRAGVSEDGEWSKTAVGTPQGAVISPLLANIYLHYVLDLWVQAWRRRKARGELYIVRYADDFVIGCQYQDDAQRCLQALKERLFTFGLELHEQKTRLIEFGRFASANRRQRGERKAETFDFLGFTHICGRRKKDGGFMLRRQTQTKRLRQKIKEIRTILLQHRHKPVPEQGKWLHSVVQGYFNYHAIPGNSRSLQALRTEVQHAWLYALRRRSQKGKKFTWERMKRLIATWIPRVRILHPYPNLRFCVRPAAGAV
ncbi:group II intron reverse transcriptase/maturase [bacterium]|nr:group II intron reverse transcriptase/maturase [bacterium]